MVGRSFNNQRSQVSPSLKTMVKPPFFSPFVGSKVWQKKNSPGHIKNRGDGTNRLTDLRHTMPHPSWVGSLQMAENFHGLSCGSFTSLKKGTPSKYPMKIHHLQIFGSLILVGPPNPRSLICSHGKRLASHRNNTSVNSRTRSRGGEACPAALSK